MMAGQYSSLGGPEWQKDRTRLQLTKRKSLHIKPLSMTKKNIPAWLDVANLKKSRVHQKSFYKALSGVVRVYL